MALEDDVRAALDKRFETAPTNLTVQVHGPVAIPPDKGAVVRRDPS
jgi:hypothetical protein